MGKQTQTFDKAQALAMHYIPCCMGEAEQFIYHNENIGHTRCISKCSKCESY